MNERNPLVVVLLSLLTCSLYAFYWLYATTDELRRETGDEGLNPLVDLLLAVVTFGLWGLWATYRNAKVTHRELGDRGVVREDRSAIIGALNVGTLVSGMLWLVSMAILQEDYNTLARHSTLAPPADALFAG